MLFQVGRTVARNASVDENDTIAVKKALRILDLYQEPEWGLSPWPDESMFGGVELFQADSGLAVDGVIRPNGPTERQLDKRLRARYEEIASTRSRSAQTERSKGVQRPTLSKGLRAMLSGHQPTGDTGLIKVSGRYNPTSEWRNSSAWAFKEAGRTVGGMLGLAPILFTLRP